MIGSRADKVDQVIKICCIALIKPEIGRTNYLHNHNYMNKAYVNIFESDEKVSIQNPATIGWQFYITQILT